MRVEYLSKATIARLEEYLSWGKRDLVSAVCGNEQTHPKFSVRHWSKFEMALEIVSSTGALTLEE